jgi:hypothetical protein
MDLTKEAAHIRSRIKHAGIKARVRVAPGGGSIQVNAPSYEAVFSDEEQRKIRLIAKVNGFTWVRGMEIVLEQMTNPSNFNFYKSA